MSLPYYSFGWNCCFSNSHQPLFRRISFHDANLVALLSVLQLKKRISDKKHKIVILAVKWKWNFVVNVKCPSSSFLGSICTPSYRVYYSMYVSTLFIFLFFWFSALRHYDKKHDDSFLIRRFKTILTNLILQYLTS